MARIVRNTKFRHVFGQAAKKSDCYDNIRITRGSWDSTFCSVNPKFLAIITESAGGGSFLVLPLEKVGRVDRNVPLVTGHKAAVLDIAWCPHNDNVIASGSEDCTVKIWEIPDGGIAENLTESKVELAAHQRRVGQVLWHPSALNVLLSVGGDMKIFVWNTATAEVLSSIDCHPDSILSASWNYNGSRIVSSCKDKMIRVINPRNGEVINSGIGHQGGKPTRAIYLRDGRIFSTGFSKMAERQYAVWDENDLSAPLTMTELDSSNGIIFPIYDEDIDVIYLCGKGDSVIRYFEYTPEAPYIHYLNSYSSSDPQRGIGVMPKRALNVSACEIARFYKLLNSGLCEVINFTVPRKSGLFQGDLYPDTAAPESAITADEWINGKNADPKLISIRDQHSGRKSVFIPHDDPITPIVKVEPKPTVTDKPSINPNTNGASSKPQPKPITPAPAPDKKDNKQLESIMEKLDAIMNRMDDFDRRLKLLENSSIVKETVNENVKNDGEIVKNEEEDNDDLKF